MEQINIEITSRPYMTKGMVYTIECTGTNAIHPSTFYARPEGENKFILRDPRDIFNGKTITGKHAAENALFCLATDKAEKIQKLLTPQIKDLTEKTN